MENNNMNGQDLNSKRKIILFVYAILIIIIIVGFVNLISAYNSINTIGKNIDEDIRMNHIIAALNNNKYTSRTNYTLEDFKAKIVVESDYKPIYKITTNDGYTLYIGLLIPQGDNIIDDTFCSMNLESVKKALND